ncbi:PP2C family protein-serine/threonine phosphatase [Sanguibacter suaedae]|uniref:SpoIIE family protein phosphatase n=1 Tax=Sanguibacter suaedae TaxID=2795737 RepID=A0A934MBM6_9MICO|nr:SpoIIE family protein phosphatase [Sanguibacter suaedae]MBI9115481.1 SpoIIE family protein phosphatase [Sanguibacter suaedae]
MSQDAGLRVLLVEDDDGDALLVDELFEDSGLLVELRRARSVDEALTMLDVDCVLLDLGLPDSVGLSGVERVQGTPGAPALVVLTGLSDGAAALPAVAAGAQDYLVKDDVDGRLLARSVLYAVERRRSEVQERALYRNAVRAEETARLERALLPSPAVVDDRLAVHVGYLPGGNGLLGGDFYDVVERPDGSVLCVVGDVAGHGPDEAALGATLRTAWRTLVLAGTEPSDILGLVERVLVHERSRQETFTTLCQVVVHPARATADIYLAGHPAPILLGTPSTLVEPTARGKALGIPVESAWNPQRVGLGDEWWLMIYTDGLVEATVDAPTEVPAVRGRTPRPRLGTAGLLEASASAFRGGTTDLVGRLLREVRGAHGGRLEDDAAVLVLGWPGTVHDGAGERSATLADSEEWT